MATEPKTVRETNIAMEGMEGRLVARLSSLSRVVWTVIGLLTALLIGAFGIYKEVGQTNTEIGAVKAVVAASNDRLNRLDDRFNKLDDRLNRIEAAQTQSRAAENDMARVLARIETHLDPNSQPRDDAPKPPPIQLSDEEMQIIREVLQVTPSSGKAIYEVGGRVTAAAMVPFLPPAIVAKVPQLKGLRYTIDGNGAVVVVDPASYRVVAIISPSRSPG